MYCESGVGYMKNRIVDIEIKKIEKEIDSFIVRSNLVEKNHYDLKEKIVPILRTAFKYTQVYANRKGGSLFLVVSSGKKYPRQAFVYLPIDIKSTDEKIGNAFGRVYSPNTFKINFEKLDTLYFTKGKDIKTLKELIDIVNAEAERLSGIDENRAKKIANILKDNNISLYVYTQLIKETDSLKKMTENWLEEIKKEVQ